MLEPLISRAQHRFALLEGLAQTAVAAAVAIGGFALLLIVGTRYLAVWTVSLFALAGLAIGAIRFRRRLPNLFETARRLDEGAGLHDTLSTALYFSRHDPPGGPSPRDFRLAQRAAAEQLSESVKLESAVPFRFPRTLYWLAGVAVFASALVGVRYRPGRGIDLRPPITQVFFPDLAAPLLAKNEPRDRVSERSAMEKAIDQALEAPVPGDKRQPDLKKGSPNPDSADQTPGDPLPNPDPSALDQVDLANNPSASQDSKDGEDQRAGKEPTAAEKESLLSRLKDAVENFLKSDRSESREGQKGQQQAKRGDAKTADSSGGQKGQPQQNQEQQAGGQEAEAEAEANAERAKEGQAKQSSASGKEQKGENGSGIGSQEGKKEIKLAEQLKAMGKISEIIGQRANSVSGETTIEKQSGDQNLTTAWSSTAASHGETDGDVTRDRISIALQSYVRQYFEEVRKSAATAKKVPAAVK